MQEPVFLGLDLGHHQVKALGNGRRVEFPALYSRARSTSLLELGRNEASVDDISIVLNTGDEYLVGEKARIHNPLTDFDATGRKIGDIGDLVSTLAAVGLCVFEEPSPIHVRVAVGLPISDFETYKDIVRSLVAGEHRFTLKSGGKTFNKHVIVERVYVIPQGVAAFLDTVFDDRGVMRHNPTDFETDLRRVKTAVIDFGGRTTDVALIRGFTPIPEYCRSIPIGVSSFLQIARNALNLESLTIAQLDAALVSGGKLLWGNEERDLGSLFGSCATQIGESLAREIDNSWYKVLMDAHNIVICGGGAPFYLPSLKARLPKIFGRAKLVPDGRFSNARGYIKYARFAARLEEDSE